jgi:hypothetical protein
METPRIQHQVAIGGARSQGTKLYTVQRLVGSIQPHTLVFTSGILRDHFGLTIDMVKLWWILLTATSHRGETRIEEHRSVV